MRLLRKILFPLSFLYAGVMYIRNKLYDSGILKSHSYNFPVIGVGNLSVGGTGKSPMIEYLIDLLRGEGELATLSRGYKRETEGFVLLTGKETARQVGDEPLQFKSKFPELKVAVDEKRARGIRELRKLVPIPEVILLDDVFQHRKVNPGLKILLTAFGDLYSEDSVLPSGNLREPKSGARRAHLIVVTKCPPDLTSEAKAKIRRQLQIEEGQQLVFSGISYATQLFNQHTSISLDSIKKRDVTLVTGIANPGPLMDYLKRQEVEFRHLAFPDHHNFSEKELEKITKLPCVITTEKDFMRLRNSMVSSNLYFLPIQMKFLSAEEKREFEEAVLRFIKKK